MRYGFLIPTGDPRSVAELAREVEEAGWDGVFYWDGICVGDMETYDPWVVMSGDGHAHGEGEDRGRLDAASPAETVEAGPRDGHPRPFLQRAPRLAGRTRGPGRRWFLEGGGTDRQEGSGTASRRESGDTHRVVERGAVLLFGRALPDRGDDFSASSCPEATHTSMGGRSVAEQEVDAGGLYAMTGCLPPRSAEDPNRRASRPRPSARSESTSGRTEKRTAPSTSYGKARRQVKTLAGRLHRASLRGGRGHLVDRIPLDASQRAGGSTPVRIRQGPPRLD